MSPANRRPSLRLQIPSYHPQLRNLALIFLNIKAWKAAIPPKLPSYDQSNPPRNKNLCEGAADCKHCVEFRNIKEFERPLVVCRPFLWTMDISHLVMVLEMRIARSEEESLTFAEGDGEGAPSLQPLEIIDKMIADGIAAVLAHEKIGEEDYNELARLRKRVEAAKEKLDGIEGVDAALREGLERVIEEMEECCRYGTWAVFSLGILPREFAGRGIYGGRNEV